MSRNLDGSFVSALTSAGIMPCFLVQITFNSGVAYAWSGIGDLVWEGNTYKGVGGLGNIAAISEGSDVKAAGTSISLSFSASAAALANGTAVLVPATAVPWDTAAGKNPSYFFGCQDGSPPIVVPLALTAGEVLTISATGLTDDGGGGAIFGIGSTGGGGPNGTPPPTGSGTGLSGLYFPTKFMSGSTLAASGLCGAFTDANGNVIQPVSIGAGGSFTVPTGAVQLQLGIDDDIYSDNSGYFIVTVTPPGGGVTSASLLQEVLGDIRLGAPVFIYFGLLSGGGILGPFLGTPYRVFYGSVDKPTIKVGVDTISISLALENRLVDLQRANQRRYTAADQHIMYPDDMGFNWVEILNDIALRWG